MMNVVLSRRVALINAIVAIVLTGLAVWALYVSIAAADDAVRRYGENVDSGAIEGMVATIYLGPCALLFAMSALAVWKMWRPRWFIQAIALAWLTVPVILSSI
jgi:hypothetical protein